jgi:hypothetical protein
VGPIIMESVVPLPEGVVARILAICGNSASLSASADMTRKAASIARLNKWRQWLNSVYVYQEDGYTWNRCGIEALLKDGMRSGKMPQLPIIYAVPDTQGKNFFEWVNQEQSVVAPNKIDGTRMSLFSLAGLESEQRWVPFGLSAYEHDAFDKLSRRARYALMVYDRWRLSLSTQGTDYSSLKMNQCDLALLQGLRPVQHLLEDSSKANRVWDIQADDVNIYSYAASNPLWKTEPVCNRLCPDDATCTHKCEQQNCRSAVNCTNDCHFTMGHRIPHLCKMHWGILLYELDSDDDVGSSYSSPPPSTRGPWQEDF